LKADAAIADFLPLEGADYDPEAEDIVPDMWACPICHEARVDMLAIQRDEDGEPLDAVICENCGAHYDIEVTPEAKVEAFDPETRDMAELVLVERY
jgi:transcription elongation factor Elf1